jgi:hypothetical protein
MLIGHRKLFCEGEYTMPELVTTSEAQQREEQKIETPTVMPAL